jgi:hypothetical protein
MQERLWGILRNRKRFSRLRVGVELSEDRRILPKVLLQRIDPVLVAGVIG